MIKTIRFLYVAIIAVSVVVACAARLELVSKSAAVPSGVDLSGQWIVRQASSAPRTQNRADDFQIRIPPSGSVRRNGSRRSTKRSSDSSVRVFLEFGERLKITQTKHGLFISFDRSVVEEYTFGENRLISIGPIDAQRVSGWESEALVIETLDEGGSILRETWQLTGDVLLRTVSINKGDKQQFSSQQEFDRVEVGR